MIYVLKAGEFYKIGYSDIAEARIAYRHVRGEWFALTIDDIQWIDSQFEKPMPKPKKTVKTDIEKRIERARRDVASRIGQQKQISQDLGVHYNWVRQFASGDLVEPGAVKFAHLEEWLEKHR
jgi:hypothetical protein